MTDAHAEIESLLGAYVLDAVDPDERAEVERHLPTCPRCRAEVHELREVTALLANSGAAAPEGVWDRIVASLEEAPPPLRLSLLSQPEAPAPSTTTPASAPGVVVPFRRRRPLLAGIAAAAAVVIGVVGFSLGRVSDSSSTTAIGLAAAANTAFGEAGSRSTDLVTPLQVKEAVAVVRRNGEGYLLGENLPDAGGRIYQLWGATADGSVVSLGVLDQPGVMAFHIDDSIDTLMLTQEERPVPQPSTAPVAQGQLA